MSLFLRFPRYFSKSRIFFEECETHVKKSQKDDCLRKAEERNRAFEKVFPPKHKKGSYIIYKTISLFLAAPLIAAATYIVFIRESCPERPPFVAYEYLRRRTKKFPWGDGNHTLFHNPATNALPDGYETELNEDVLE